MRNYIILNGSSSLQINGLLIQSLAPISKPLIRTQVEEIDGRDGDIITPLGFSAYDKEITVGLYGNFDINEIVAFFNSEGVVTFSNEPDKYYNYQIIEQIDFERLVRYKTAKVTMHCQPFKYSTTEGAETISPSDNLLSIPDTTKTSNGVTVTSANGVISVQGTPTAATEIYLPITSLTLQAGSYTMDATANGQNPSNCSMRLIGSAPSNSDSFGGKYITLTDGTVTLQATLSASKTFGFLWFYINAGKALNFKLTTELEDDSTKTASDEGSAIVLEGTGEAPFNRLDLKGNATQDSTPTPDSPIPVNVVTGEQTINITGKNLLNINDIERVYPTSSISGSVTDGTLTLTAIATTGAQYVRYQLGLNAGKVYTISGKAKKVVKGADGTPRIVVKWRGSNDNGATWTAYADIYNVDPNQGVEYSFSGSFTGYALYQILFYNNAATPVSVGEQTQYWDLQVETGSTATAYEPYQAQSYKINLGKNLLPISHSSSTATVSNITATSNDDGTITLNGTGNANGWLEFVYDFKNGTTQQSSPTVMLDTAETYTLSSTVLSGSITGTPFITLQTDVGGTAKTADVGSSVSFTGSDGIYRGFVRVASGQVFNNAKIGIQIEAGSQATTFAPYFTPIELAKIGDYQDYIWNDEGTWYISRAIGKVVLDGSEAGWGIFSNNNAFYSGAYSDIAKPSTTTTVGAIMSDYYTANSENAIYNATVDYGIGISSQNRILFRNKDIATVADFKTWLGSHNTTVYYALATPTDEAITDQDLIDALDDLYSQAHAYKGRTHITALAATGNAPHIITAEVVKSSDGVVTNSGNIYSKPKLTIYGSGDISVYLNGLQVFQIALGNEGYITIDTNAMEAYKDTIDNLKNRLVTGDYNNFALQVGENQITFSGAVTKCIVQNYSRWL